MYGFNAFNYNENAEEDDGSCCYIAGCTDEMMFNYNPNACYDDNSCVFVMTGCTHLLFNYDPQIQMMVLVVI